MSAVGLVDVLAGTSPAPWRPSWAVLATMTHGGDRSEGVLAGRAKQREAGPGCAGSVWVRPSHPDAGGLIFYECQGLEGHAGRCEL